MATYHDRENFLDFEVIKKEKDPIHGQSILVKFTPPPKIDGECCAGGKVAVYRDEAGTGTYYGGEKFHITDKDTFKVVKVPINGTGTYRVAVEGAVYDGRSKNNDKKLSNIKVNPRITFDKVEKGLKDGGNIISKIKPAKERNKGGSGGRGFSPFD